MVHRLRYVFPKVRGKTTSDIRITELLSEVETLLFCRTSELVFFSRKLSYYVRTPKMTRENCLHFIAAIASESQGEPNRNPIMNPTMIGRVLYE